MTYAELQTAVEAWTHRTDLATLLPTFVEHAEARLNRDLRVRQMEAEMAPTAISVDGEVGLPSGWLGFKRVWVSGMPRWSIDPQTLDYVEQFGSTGGNPSFYAINGSVAVFDGSGTVEAIYYESIPGLQANGSNWLSNAHPDLYLHATLVAASEYTRDAAMGGLSDGKAQALIDKLNRMDQRDRFSGQLSARKN